MLKSIGFEFGFQRRVLALAEGPFGTSFIKVDICVNVNADEGEGAIHSFDSYGSTILIAGGIGITHSISYLRELVDGFARGSVATRRITLLWVVRSIGTSAF